MRRRRPRVDVDTGPILEAPECLFLMAVGYVEAHGALGLPSTAVSPGQDAGQRVRGAAVFEVPSMIVGKVPAVGVALKDQVPRGASVLQEKAFQRLADHLPQEGVVRARQFSAVCIVVLPLRLKWSSTFESERCFSKRMQRPAISAPSNLALSITARRWPLCSDLMRIGSGPISAVGAPIPSFVPTTIAVNLQAPDL